VDVEVLFGRELLARGHEIDFVMQAADARTTPGPHKWFGRTVHVGATDLGKGFVHRVRKHWLNFAHDVKSLSLIRADRYDAVQVRDKFLIAALAAPIARSRGVKFFYWLSFPHPEELVLRARSGAARYKWPTLLRGHLSRWLLYRWILPRSAHAFVQSEKMKQDIVACGIDPNKLTAVPMGISVDDVPRDEPLSHDERAPLIIGYLGTLDAYRHPEILIDLLDLVLKQSIDARLLLVGDSEKPADRARLEQRAAELGVRDKLTITGLLPRADALARIRQADICISPFYPSFVLLSSSPTKLVEYMALGLPVIANDHPEQRLVLQQSGAGVCVPWGARHFARAVRFLARRGADERRNMGHRGREWVLKNRTYARLSRDLEQHYQHLLTDRPVSAANDVGR
jgi:glycosyltransferase involved in cell wall biosynthesis